MSNATDEVVVTPEQLQAQIKQLEATQAERDRKIQELTVENATLEARSTSVQTPPPALMVDATMTDDAIASQTQKIMEDMATDPAKASKDLASLIKKVATSTATIAANGVASSIQPTIENEKFAEKIRTDNQDLLALSPAMEDIVAAEANAIVRALPRQQQTFQEFQKAVKAVVIKKREAFKDLLKKTEEKPAEVPAGAKSESGGGMPVGSTVSVKKTSEDDKTSPSARAARNAALGL